MSDIFGKVLTRARTAQRVARTRSKGRRAPRSGYQIERLTRREYETLRWLSAHGYDAGILDAAGVRVHHPSGDVTLGSIPEHKAWEINEAIETDPHAFLASNGSRSLADKLMRFINSIV